MPRKRRRRARAESTSSHAERPIADVMAEVRARVRRKDDALADLLDLVIELGWYAYTSTRESRAPASRVAGPDWRRELGLAADATLTDAERAYRRQAMRHHPDRPGGSASRMARLNAAREAARRELA